MRNEKNLVLALKKLKHKESQLKKLNDELRASEEELRQLNEELATTNELLNAKNREERKTRKELEKQTYLLDAFMNLVPDAIYFKDRESKFIRISKAHAKMFGYDNPNDLVGKSDFDFFRDEHALPAYNSEQKIIKTLKPIINIIEKETWKDGHETWAKTSKMPLFDLNGNVMGTFGISRDITEQKKLKFKLQKQNIELQASEEELRQLNEELSSANGFLYAQKEELETILLKLKETQSQLVQAEKMASVGILTAGITHEINNPLNFIQGGKTAIESYINKNAKEHVPELIPLIEIIETGITRISEIVESLNRFNRKSETNIENCDIHSIIDNCLVMLHNQTKNKIEVNKQYTNVPFTHIGNEGKLHQVILNVLINAVQAISKKGTISIITKVEKEKISIQISDTGCGISKENIEKVINPFFTTKDPGKGTGLGLSIAYNIIKEHKGTLIFESELNEGTTVTIKLPVNYYKK